MGASVIEVEFCSCVEIIINRCCMHISFVITLLFACPISLYFRTCLLSLLQNLRGKHHTPIKLCDDIVSHIVLINTTIISSKLLTGKITFLNQTVSDAITNIIYLLNSDSYVDLTWQWSIVLLVLFNQRYFVNSTFLIFTCIDLGC